MIEFQKKPPYKNKFYIEYVKSLGCCVPGCNKDCDQTPHHMDTGGMAMGGPDLITLRICGIHHEEIHRSPKKFEIKYQINIYQEIVRDWEAYVIGLIKYTERIDKENKDLKRRLYKAKIRGFNE